MTKYLLPYRFVCSFLLVMLAGFVTAQENEELNSRFPETGIAVMDCKPAKPAPIDSCVVRIPHNARRGQLEKSNTSAEFDFLKADDEAFPDDLSLSATLLLIDVTPGPNRGRAGTWSQEKAQIKRLAQALPRGESVAVYSFNENLTRLQRFTRDRSAVLDVIEGLELVGTNTRISTHTRGAIEALSQREDVLFKNIVLISDGDEEGIKKPEGIVEDAIRENISISTFGMFWRTLGVDETATAMDYLEQIAVSTNGLFRSAQLRRSAEVRDSVDEFIERYNSAIEQSGLILPDGEPMKSEISFELKKPVPGQPDSYRSSEVSVLFVPAIIGQNSPAENEDGAETKQDEDDTLLWGYPALYVYVAIGLAALLLLGLLVLLLRKAGGSSTNDDTFIGDDRDDLATQLELDDGPSAAPIHKPEPVRPLAYLIDEATGKRHPITNKRVTIGRGTGCDIVLGDTSVSRSHAELMASGANAFAVADLGSMNGTFVNDNKVEKAVKIAAGDVIKFGNVKVRFTSA